MNSISKKYPPPLPLEEELFLFDRYKNEGCLKSIEKVIVHNLHHISYIAKPYFCDGADDDDLFQQGVIGLMKAAKSFDTSKKMKFITFAVHYIKSEIITYVHNNFGIVKTITTKSRKKLFNNIYKLKDSLDTLNPNEISNISKKLNVSENDVYEVEEILAIRDKSTDLEIFDTNADNEITFGDTLIHPDTTNYLTLREESDNIHQLDKALATLDVRSKEIFYARRLEEPSKTLQQLSDIYKVSKERIRQIEEIAFNKVKESFNS